MSELLYQRIPKTIRRAPMLCGVELETKETGEIVLPETEPNFNRVKFVDVLKVDQENRPVWWMDGGINWVHFEASSKSEAIELMKLLTDQEFSQDCDYSTSGIYVEDGYATFRLHR